MYALILCRIRIEEENQELNDATSVLVDFVSDRMCANWRSR
jgi:hypothetical protein